MRLWGFRFGCTYVLVDVILFVVFVFLDFLFGGLFYFGYTLLWWLFGDMLILLSTIWYFAFCSSTIRLHAVVCLVFGVFVCCFFVFWYSFPFLPSILVECVFRSCLCSMFWFVLAGYGFLKAWFECQQEGSIDRNFGLRGLGQNCLVVVRSGCMVDIYDVVAFAFWLATHL